ncbi:MAG: energy transducer TonB [Alphaproteobacteria bacterium]
MLARTFAPLTGADGRGRWLAIAASLAFHLVVIGALIWLFVPSTDEREATVTIEVTIVGPDGAESPAHTGTAQTPPAAQGMATPHKPPPPAARENRPQSAPPSMDIPLPPPLPSSSEAIIPPPPPTRSELSPAPATAANTARTDGAAQPGTVGPSGAAGAASVSNRDGDIASAGQPGSGEGDRPPRYKLGSGSTPYPPYPMVARRNGYQGRVVVRLEVAADGRATDAQVLESSGYDVLDESAVNTLKVWKLEPALLGGRPVPGSVNVPVRFRLSG